MKQHFIAGILLLSLVGLTIVQFKLLLSGVRLEKLRFDQRAKEVLLAVADSLDQPSPRSGALIEQLKIGQHLTDTLLVHPISDSLDALLRREARKKGIAADFAFAFTPVYTTEVLLANRTYHPKEFNFNRYQVRLGNQITGNCHFEPVLHFDVPNLFAYLLGELRNLVVPSALCLVAILSCFLLLLNILKNERKLNAIKNDFINNLTHELKTPTFSISLSSKMAKESLVKNDLQRTANFLQLIENENNRIKTHVEKVLELASLENPRYNLQKAPTNLPQLIREVASEFAPAITDMGGSLDLKLLDDDASIAVDVAHLKNALRNLLDNSLKYSTDRPIIEIVLEKKGGQIHISVSDNGPGIAPGYQKQVFDKFYRIPTKGPAQPKGFGLGLSYVMQIAKAHGGKVVLESRPGFGAKFTVVIPI